MNDREWLDDLKPGDFVAIPVTSSFFDPWKTHVKLVVTRRTLKLICARYANQISETKDAERQYRASDGKGYGKTKGHIVPLTDELSARIARADNLTRTRSNVQKLSAITRNDLYKLTSAQAVKAFELTRELLELLEGAE